jgi:hypothetical protein
MPAAAAKPAGAFGLRKAGQAFEKNSWQAKNHETNAD